MSIGQYATTVSQNSDAIRVTLHSTQIVVIYPNGRIVLDHAGWTTPITLRRMNQVSEEFGLGYRVYQKSFAWYVAVDGHVLEFDKSPLTIRNGLDTQPDRSIP